MAQRYQKLQPSVFINCIKKRPDIFGAFLCKSQNLSIVISYANYFTTEIRSVIEPFSVATLTKYIPAARSAVLILTS